MVDLGQKKVNSRLPFFILQSVLLILYRQLETFYQSFTTTFSVMFINHLSNLFIIIIPRRYFFPIDHIKECANIIRSSVLVI